MPHIFISYAKRDTRLLARALFDALNAIDSLTAWMDESLEADESWAYQIEQEIDQADYVVVLLSPDVNRPKTPTQQRSFVLNEIDYARQGNKPILPVLVQRTKIPVLLSNVHYIDLTMNPHNPDSVVERVCQRFRLESPSKRRQREVEEEVRRLADVKHAAYEQELLEHAIQEDVEYRKTEMLAASVDSEKHITRKKPASTSSQIRRRVIAAVGLIVLLVAIRLIVLPSLDPLPSNPTNTLSVIETEVAVATASASETPPATIAPSDTIEPTKTPSSTFTPSAVPTLTPNILLTNQLVASIQAEVQTAERNRLILSWTPTPSATSTPSFTPDLVLTNQFLSLMQTQTMDALQREQTATENVVQTHFVLSRTPTATFFPSLAPTLTLDLREIPSSTMSLTIATVNVESANLRSGPGTAYQAIGYATQGETFTVLSRNGDGNWLFAQDDVGNQFWIAVSVISSSLNINLLPTSSNIPTTVPQLGLGNDTGDVTNQFQEEPACQRANYENLHMYVFASPQNGNPTLPLLNSPNGSEILPWIQHGDELDIINVICLEEAGAFMNRRIWFRVRTLSGLEGWISRYAVTFTQ